MVAENIGLDTENFIISIFKRSVVENYFVGVAGFLLQSDLIIIDAGDKIAARFILDLLFSLVVVLNLVALLHDINIVI